MDEPGISINEACTKRAELGSGYLTDEDFANQCNPDGAVKQDSKTTVLSLSDGDTAVTVNTTLLYAGVSALVLITAIAVAFIFRRTVKKN